MTIQLSFNINKDMGLHSITFLYNDTDLPENSKTLKDLSIATLKSIAINKESIMVQDLLNELDIKMSDK